MPRLNNIGKKLVDMTVGKDIDRAVNKRDKVELSKDAKERIKRGALDSKYGLPVDSKYGLPVYEREKPDEAVLRMFQRNPNYRMGEETEATPEKYKRGGEVSASKRADGCCVRGKTRGKVY